MPCDYSLETVTKIDAAVGETYTIARFPSGTKGFVTPAEAKALATATAHYPACAVCMKEGTLLHITKPDGAIDLAVFAKLEIAGNFHRDGLIFGARNMSLQELPAGTQATVLMIGAPNAKEDAALAGAPQVVLTEPPVSIMPGVIIYVNAEDYVPMFATDAVID